MPFPIFITLSLQKVVDQLLQNNPQTLERCANLQDNVIKFVIQGVDATAYILVVEDGLEIMTEYDYEADVVFSGFPSGYVALSKNSEQALLDDKISIKGDFSVGQKFSHLIDSIEIDLEKHFSDIIGTDLSQHFFSDKGLKKTTLCDYKRNQWQYILQQALNVLPKADEVNGFNSDAHNLESSLAKIEKKIQIIKNNISTHV